MNRAEANSALALALRGFLASCRDPVLTEPGEESFALEPSAYALDERPCGLYLQAWDSRRTFSRRVTGIAARKRGRLDLLVERFGKRQGTAALWDAADRSNYCAPLRASRHVFRERFRAMLSRQFPGFTVARLSTEPDLEHSLSPSYPRALLEQRHETWAAIASPPGAGHASGVLTFGLIWLDYLRRTRKVRGLAIFLPEGQERATCLRMRHLNRSADWRVFSFSPAGERLIDLSDYGNLDTRLESQGMVEYSSWAGPEREIERQVRAGPEALDARLLPAPVYGQAPSLIAAQRGVIDLLAAGRDGRLTIIELKASEDVHLPLQSLDYWIRVKWHLDRGEFTSQGYFPGLTLRREAPRIILAAPALQFHPTCETILRFLDPTIEVERLGLGPHLKVVFRMSGLPDR